MGIHVNLLTVWRTLNRLGIWNKKVRPSLILPFLLAHTRFSSRRWLQNAVRPPATGSGSVRAHIQPTTSSGLTKVRLIFVPHIGPMAGLFEADRPAYVLPSCVENGSYISYFAFLL
jgi:hypothetical protein